MQEDQNNTPSTNKEIDELRKSLEDCEKAKNELVELSQRIKADFMNYKKEQEKATASVRQYANWALLDTFLPILDSLELALEHMPPELEKNQWAQGVKNIKSQIDEMLKSIGVAEIRAEGEPFNPHLHEAIAETESEKDDGTVLEELQKGYKLHDKILRPSKVKISIKKPN